MDDESYLQMVKATALPYRPCVGILVLNSKNLVWVGHRIYIDMKQHGGELALSDKRWQMPQGGIDKGEDSLDAAKRELFEETGMISVSYLAKVPGWVTYDLPAELIGSGLKGKYRGQKMAWYAFRFEGDDNEINITNPPEGAPVEFDSYDWVPMHKLPELIVPFKRDVYETVVSKFKHLLDE